MVSRPTKSKIPQAGKIFTQVRRAANAALIDEVGAWAEIQKDNFRTKIERQVFPDFREIYYPESGTNLSPRWLSRKSSKGADSRTMIATGHYKNSIRVWRTLRKNRQGADFRIGFHPRIQARDLDNKRVPILLSRVAQIQEYGSVKARIPRRRHWGPHYADMRLAAIGERPKMRLAVLGAIRTAVSAHLKVSKG
jgi:hypothetical protein